MTILGTLLFVAIVAVGLMAWAGSWGTRRTDRARRDLEHYGTYGRRRVGR